MRTEGQAVAQLGWMLARLVLTPQQLHLTRTAPPRVFVTGPPGTGKTVVLALMGLKRLLAGEDVRVVSTWPVSLAASRLIHHQLHRTLQACRAPSRPVGRLHFDSYDLFQCETDVERAVSELTTASRGGRLNILMDEAWVHVRYVMAWVHVRYVMTWVHVRYVPAVGYCGLKLRAPPVFWKHRSYLVLFFG